MENILLTGSSGFIGRNLKEFITLKGYNVIKFDRHDRNYYDQFADLASKNHLDCVINCAGIVKNPEEMMLGNLDLVTELLHFSKLFGAKKFIQIGSSSEAGNVNHTRFEYDRPRPIDMYSGTKAAATMYCQGFAHEYDFDVSIARPFTVYGKYEQDSKLIPTLYKKFINKEKLDLYPGAHDFVNIEDFCEGIHKLLITEKRKTKGEIFHFGTGKSTSNEEVVKLFEKLAICKFDIVEHDQKLHKYDCDFWASNMIKVNTILNWYPQISLEQGIQNYINWRWFSVDQSGANSGN